MRMPKLAYDRYYAELEAEAARFAVAVGSAEPEARVPTCPEWTFADLIHHVGRAHRWAAAIVARRATSFVPFETVDDTALPETTAERAAWLVAGAAQLVDAIREAGPDSQAWSWAGDHRAAFWARRILHETVVHRADAELALGRPFVVAPDVAADTVSEWFDLIMALDSGKVRATLTELTREGQVLHFHATDDGFGPDGEWLVRLEPSGVEWEPGHGKGDVAVRASVVNLLLVTQRRLPPSHPGVEVLGDATLLDRWLAGTAF
jgi:uncharacterized protein (TIGR03083 family)